jgi:hypothetical protein
MVKNIEINIYILLLLMFLYIYIILFSYKEIKQIPIMDENIYDLKPDNTI